jgi:hypothetical protein
MDATLKFNGRVLVAQTNSCSPRRHTQLTRPSPMSTTYQEGESLGGGGSYPGGGSVVPPGGDYVDLHELAKGWKAAIARAKDPATR